MKLFSRKGSAAGSSTDFVSPQEIERVLAQTSPATGLQRERVYYLILQVKDDTLEQIADRVAKATDLVVESQGIVIASFSSIIAAVFRKFPNQPEPADQMDDAVQQLRNAFPDDVRALYGQTDGLFGESGSQKYLGVGPIISSLSPRLVALLRLPFGEVNRFE